MSTPPDVPPGFRVIRAGGPFTTSNGPLYLHHAADVVKIGFRVEDRHCNPMGMCHGGMLATFADMLLPLVAHRMAPELRDRFLPTVSLQIDYLSPAALGDWVEGQAQVLKVTRRMAFVQGTATSGGVMALRCSGVFKIGPAVPAGAMPGDPSAPAPDQR